MYSQLIVIAFSDTWGKLYDELPSVIFTKTGNTRAVTKLIPVLYGILDLDFISHAVPPFCVSKDLRLYHRAISMATSHAFSSYDFNNNHLDMH